MHFTPSSVTGLQFENINSFLVKMILEWPLTPTGRELCILSVITARLSYFFKWNPLPPARLVDAVLCCNVSHEPTHFLVAPSQSNTVAPLTGNVHHLLCHAWGPVVNTDTGVLWPSPLLCIRVIFKNPSWTGGTNREDFEDVKGAEGQITHHFTPARFTAFFKTMCP